LQWHANPQECEVEQPTYGVQGQSGGIKSEEGLSIAFRFWRPTAQARGIVVIVPGFNSHSGYYAWVAEQFVAAHLAVYAIDLRGRGKSEGERFYVKDFADYVSDIAAIADLAKSREPSVPIFLLGHSAGGVAACLYALDHQTTLKGFICESFAYELPAPGLALSAIKGLSHVAPHAHVLQLKNEDFSRDSKFVQAMNEDPLIARESQPAETLAALIRADERLGQSFPRLTLPLLILHGTSDKAAKASGSQHFYETAGSSDKTLKLYEGAFHDPLNDLNRKNVISDITDWIEGHLAT
jgi:acylglycerol lipase